MTKVNTIQYRLYADGEIVDQDDFNEKDNALPLYDDFREFNVPEEWTIEQAYTYIKLQ